MIINLFKLRKRNIFYLLSIIVFSVVLAYFFVATIDYTYYSIFYYSRYIYKMHPETYINDAGFLKMFDNTSIIEGWEKVKSSSYFNDNINTIINTTPFDITKNLLIMLSLIFSSYICVIIISFFTSVLSSQFYLLNSRKMDYKILSFNKDEIENITAHVLLNDINYDIKEATKAFEMFVSNFFTAIVLIAFSIYRSYQIYSVSGYIILIFTSIYLVLLIYLLFTSFKATKDIYYSNDEYSYLLFDKIEGYKTNKMFKFTDVINKRIKTLNLKTYKNKNNVNYKEYMLNIVLSLSFYFEVIFLLYFFISSERDNQIMLITTLLFAFLTLYALLSFEKSIRMIPRYINSSRRLNKIVNHHKDNETFLPNASRTSIGEIKFENVYFAYSSRKRNVLNDLSFNISRGEKVAIISKSGGGKSTIFKLLSRDYETTSGKILIDGVNIKDIPTTRLHILLGFLYENNIVLNDDINYNITLGNNIFSKENLNYAYEVSNINDINFKSGNILSDGNKRQLQIARQMIRENEIIVLDSPYYNIDYKTAKAINDIIFKTSKSKTIIMFTNRIELLKDFDRIIYLKEGSVSFDGNYDEFKENCDDYKFILNEEVQEVSYAF